MCDYYSERDTAAANAHLDVIAELLPGVLRKGLGAGKATCQGEVLEARGENSKARASYDEAVRIATEHHDDEMLANALFSRGYLLGLQGNYSAGLVDLRRAQLLYEGLKMAHHALTTLNSIAILYNRMGDNAQARDMYTRALRAQRAAGMRREQAVTLHNLGRANENLKDWAQAREAFSASLAICRELGYARGQAYALRGLAMVANALGEPRGALVSLEQAETLQSQTPDARLKAQILLARGMALASLDRLPESIVALEGALEIFHHSGALGELATTYTHLASVHSRMGDWPGAYRDLMASKEASEKLLRNQLDQHFGMLKVEFDTATKEKENQLLMRENEASEKALKQERRVRHLQRAVIGLTVMLAALLATLALYQRRSNLRMQALAMTDELTGVPNRRAVLARLEPLLQAEGSSMCAILILDIDHFKTINDHHGHPTGDEALKIVASRLRAAVPEDGFFGRLGGEEFLIVLPRANLGTAKRVAETLREQVMSIDTATWFTDQRRITASVGVAVGRAGVDTPSTMLQRADAALYSAKRAGRNCVRTEPAVA